MLIAGMRGLAGAGASETFTFQGAAMALAKERVLALEKSRLVNGVIAMSSALPPDLMASTDLAIWSLGTGAPSKFRWKSWE